MVSFRSHRARSRFAGGLFALTALAVIPIPNSFGQSVQWTETFQDDPIVADRFSVPPGHDDLRFTYDGGSQRLTAHFDSFEPTAWYVRPLDSQSPVAFGACDEFEFTVTFRVLSAGFFADPDQFAQIGWGLINSATTGTDRAGGAGPDFAFDNVAFDYFPNVSPLFGGPTLGSTLIHSDTGAGYFSEFEFPFGAESRIDTPFGDEDIALDVLTTATVHFNPQTQVLTLTVSQGGNDLAINADGTGGPGGTDANVTTIQTALFVDHPFSVDSFAITLWQDTFNPFGSSVIADVEFSEIQFAGQLRPAGDMNGDGAANGLDIAPFVEVLLGSVPSSCQTASGDFDESQSVTIDDVGGFVAALVGS
ncbi:MAG: hypothetical protein AMXMBFR20_18760 [Planctomycetia bacterium]